MQTYVAHYTCDEGDVPLHKLQFKCSFTLNYQEFSKNKDERGKNCLKYTGCMEKTKLSITPFKCNWNVGSTTVFQKFKNIYVIEMD